MNIEKYIFLTSEGYTYQPFSESIEPDINNCQLIGISEGISPDEAFENLIKEKSYLKNTNFNEIFCYKLDFDYLNTKKYFSLKK